MWFLIKGTFWFSLVLVALSYFGSSNDPAKAPSAFDIPSAVSAAGEAYRYVSAICIEKPDVCIKGAETFHALGERAKEGARLPMNCWTSSLPPGTSPPMLPTLRQKPKSLQPHPLSASSFPQMPTC